MTNPICYPQPNYSGVTIQIANPAVNVNNPYSNYNKYNDYNSNPCVNDYMQNGSNFAYPAEYYFQKYNTNGNNDSTNKNIARRNAYTNEEVLGRYNSNVNNADYANQTRNYNRDINNGNYSNSNRQNYQDANNDNTLNSNGQYNRDVNNGNYSNSNRQNYQDANNDNYSNSNGQYNNGVNDVNDANYSNSERQYDSDINNGSFDNNANDISNENEFSNANNRRTDESNQQNNNVPQDRIMNSYEYAADPNNLNVEEDFTKSNQIIGELNKRDEELKAEQKNSKQKRVVALTDEYIKSLENYLNNPNDDIRLMASKEILTRLDEDKDRYDDAALNALLNKMLQDPSKLIRVAALSAFASQLACGNDYTVNLLHNIQQNPNADKEDVLQAADILLKMSAGTEVKNIPTPNNNQEQK